MLKRWLARRKPRANSMAPLDTGSLTHQLRLVDPMGQTTGPRPVEYETLGDYLRAVRGHRELTLNELATATRIRRLYLAAIEDSDRSALPSRPFAIGYVRAYAKALGLDGELAVQRFKDDWPETDEPLRNPVGVGLDGDPRRLALYVGVGVLVAAVALWNIAQRALVTDEPPPSAISSVEAQIKAPTGPMKVGAPVDAPTESTIPAAYVTPGIDGSATDPATGQAVKLPASTVLATVVTSSPVFTAKGAVYGSPAGPVVLQAKRPVGLMVRGGDKTVYFARQLAAGEAFRAPIGKGLTVEATDPAALDLYVGGALRGSLASPQTPLDKLAVPAAAPTAASLTPAAPRAG